MSRRTAPLYGGAHNPEHLASFLVPDRHPACIFTALDEGRFDNVRRAVEADPNCLLASTPTESASGPEGSLPPRHITPVDYAIERCRQWASMLVHCDRAGGVQGAHGYLSLRQRLAVMASIVEWLVTRPGAPLPSDTALHTVLSCNFARAARILLARAPQLACARDARGRTALHACFALTPHASAGDILAYATLLVRAGADAAARDVDGRTPLHELVASLTASQRAWGLERTRGHRATLRSLQNVVAFLVAEGADITARDAQGRSPLDTALRDGLEYLVLVRSADAVFHNVRRGQRRAVPLATFVPHTSLGLFDHVPYDVVLKILTHVPPRDAVTGIGTTCKVMHALATSDFVWCRLSAASSLAVAREVTRTQVADLGGGS